MLARRADRPLLFLDVDGPLIPFRARPHANSSMPASGNPLIDRLDPADGRKLLALDCRLVWATTWMNDANDVVAPRLGLPTLPIVDFPDDDEPTHGLHWKTRSLTHWASGHRFIWLDDEITDIDRRWVETHHDRPTLLHRVDPFEGLADADLVAVRQWLERRWMALPSTRPCDPTATPPSR